MIKFTAGQIFWKQSAQTWQSLSHYQMIPISASALAHALQPHWNKCVDCITSHCLLLMLESEPATGTPAVDPK